MQQQYLFFDSASTTACCEQATLRLHEFTAEHFGNPSSSHALGQKSARAIRDARQFFSDAFGVSPNQVVFTGSGTESDNLAIYGVATAALARMLRKSSPQQAPLSAPPRVITSAVEHAAVLKTAQSLEALGFEIVLAPVDSTGRVIETALKELITPSTVLVSIMQVNNIVGSIQPVSHLAQLVKSINPDVVFHTDAVQAFGKIDVPKAPSDVDLVSISAHKICGPKGVGALIVLNKRLLENGAIRPLVWGGGQENGLRSGTQSAGLISAFHAAAEQALNGREHFIEHTRSLRAALKQGLEERGLLPSKVRWNSPENGVPHIISLSAPRYPAGPLSKLLEERSCLVSTGSACSSQKSEPEPVLRAMGFSPEQAASSIRISFSTCNSREDVPKLVDALDSSFHLMDQLM